MAEQIFNKILSDGIRKGIIPAKEKSSRDWFRGRARKLTTVRQQNLLRGADPDRLRQQTAIGNMYMFTYNPKHKKTLPYYDNFPLIFPFAKAKGGFIGINMHYLPHVFRAKLMDSLYDIANNDRFDQKTKLAISYDLLKGASRFKYFKPTVHRYLTKHVMSRFMYVYPSEWDIALFMPTERFQKASKQKVWSDSKKIIRGQKI